MKTKTSKFKTVLVIDDEELDVYLAEKILTGSHYSDTIISYNNPKLALNYLENITDDDQIPDLILLDLSMPFFSGEDFLIYYHKTISENIRKKIKLVVLTAYKYYHESIDINSNRFPSLSKIIEKPLKIEELEEIEV